MNAFQLSLPVPSRRHQTVRLSPFARRGRPPVSKLPDVVIIGAGPAGLSTAHELALRGATVQVLATHKRRPAGLAAAGMLAPSAEQLDGPLAALCEASLALFPAFVQRLQGASGLDLRFVSRGDFLAPILNNKEEGGLTAEQARLIEPALGERVSGARRIRGDAHVDNRAVIRALRMACEVGGVVFRDDAFVRRIEVGTDGAVEGIVLEGNEMVGAGHFILAAGAWSAKLLPGLPVRPVKGQMLSLRPPRGDSGVGRLNHVLYGEKCYVVPKEDGEGFFVGATVEEGTFSEHTTAGGVMQLLTAAIELCPAFADYEVSETWSGLRPATPDLAPILGMSEFSNLSIATGYYRNGILLSPASAKIAAATALQDTSELSAELGKLVHEFSYKRFTDSDASTKTATVPPKQNVRMSWNSTVPLQSSVQREDFRGTLLWRVMPDGSREPVPPPKGFKQKRERTSTALAASDLAEVDTEMKPVSSGPVKIPERMSRTGDLVVQKQGHGDVPNHGGENDAYEDVMRHRNDAENVKRWALAENRAFGRKRSSLEKDGVPLSLSEEEVTAFDKAMEKGMQDMQGALQSFGPSHPSVIATNLEKSRLDDTTTPYVPSGAAGQTSNGESQNGANLDYDGYF